MFVGLSAFLCVGIAFGLLLLHLRRRSVQIALHPEDWPNSLSRGAYTRCTERYLKNKGWTILPPREWCGVQIRGLKDGLLLNITIDKERALSVPLLLQEAIETSRYEGLIIGVLSSRPLDETVRAAALSSGIFVFSPPELATVKEMLVQVMGIRAAWKIDSAQTNIAAKSQISEPLIKGMVGGISQSGAFGWAYDPKKSNEHIRVEILCGEQVIGSGQANIFRADLRQAGIGSGDHAFDIHFPPVELITRMASISVRGVTAQGEVQAIRLSDGVRKSLESLAKRSHGL